MISKSCGLGKRDELIVGELYHTVAKDLCLLDRMHGCINVSFMLCVIDWQRHCMLEGFKKGVDRRAYLQAKYNQIVAGHKDSRGLKVFEDKPHYQGNIFSLIIRRQQYGVFTPSLRHSLAYSRSATNAFWAASQKPTIFCAYTMRCFNVASVQSYTLVLIGAVSWKMSDFKMEDRHVGDQSHWSLAIKSRRRSTLKAMGAWCQGTAIVGISKFQLWIIAKYIDGQISRFFHANWNLQV